MKPMTVQNLAKISIIAATYVVVTLLIAPLAYGPIQFRLSEVLVLLCFFNPRYIFALTFGTLLANFFGSNLGPIDVFAGTFATLLAATLIHYTRAKFGESLKVMILSCIWPILINGVIVGWMLNYVLDLPLIPSMLSVAAGEAVVMTIGVIVFQIIQRNKMIMEQIKG